MSRRYAAAELRSARLIPTWRAKSPNILEYCRISEHGHSGRKGRRTEGQREGEKKNRGHEEIGAVSTTRVHIRTPRRSLFLSFFLALSRSPAAPTLETHAPRFISFLALEEADFSGIRLAVQLRSASKSARPPGPSSTLCTAAHRGARSLSSSSWESSVLVRLCARSRWIDGSIGDRDSIDRKNRRVRLVHRNRVAGHFHARSEKSRRSECGHSNRGSWLPQYPGFGKRRCRNMERFRRAGDGSKKIAYSESSAATLHKDGKENEL